MNIKNYKNNIPVFHFGISTAAHSTFMKRAGRIVQGPSFLLSHNSGHYII